MSSKLTLLTNTKIIGTALLWAGFDGITNFIPFLLYATIFCGSVHYIWRQLEENLLELQFVVCLLSCRESSSLARLEAPLSVLSRPNY